MARALTRTSSEYLEYGAAVVTDPPFSVFAWIFPTNTNQLNTVFSVGASATAHRHDIVLRGDVAGDFVRANSEAGAASAAITTLGYTANAWQSICGVWAAANSRAVYIEGGNKGTESTSRTVTGLDRTAIGRRSNNTPAGSYFGGSIARVAVYGVALSDTDVINLHNCKNPFMVQRSGLLDLWELQGISSPEPSLTGTGHLMTVTGAVVGDHAPLPPLWIPKIWQIPMTVPVAAGQPAILRGSGVPGMRPDRPLFGRGW